MISQCYTRRLLVSMLGRLETGPKMSGSRLVSHRTSREGVLMGMEARCERDDRVSTTTLALDSVPPNQTKSCDCVYTTTVRTVNMPQSLQPQTVNKQLNNL